MFCDEPVLKVYLGVAEDDDVYSHNAFLDCYHDIAYHCTEGYRIVLETENFVISLSSKGVTKQRKEELQENEGEWLQNGIELFEEDEPNPHPSDAYLITPVRDVTENLLSWQEDGAKRETSFFRYGAMMEGFAEIVRGERENEYSLDYELALFKTLMKACGAE